MITLYRDNKKHSLEQLRKKVSELIRKLPGMITPIGAPLFVLRYEWELDRGEKSERPDPLGWLGQQRARQKIYWADRDGSFEVAGIGCADRIKSEGPINYKSLFHYMEDRLPADNPRLRYYGGLCFDAENLGAAWHNFGTSQFVIPRFEVFNDPQGSRFAFNIAIKDIQEELMAKIHTEFEQIKFSSPASDEKLPMYQSRHDAPDYSQWQRLFDETAKLLKDSRKMTKLVLARESRLTFAAPLNPAAVMERIREITPHCFRFYFQIQPHEVFLGGSPERLYRRQNRQVESEAMAGTRPRSSDAKRDETLSRELLQSAKDLEEHRIVAEALRTSLGRVCERLNGDEKAEVIQLNGGQHLLTRFQGTLYEGINDEDLLALIHPTPAVAGHPRAEALKFLKAKEPFSRGWYAAPVGIVGHGVAEFAVAIRSALIRKKDLHLYAGAGIVPASQSQKEWEEIEDKIAHLMRLFTSSPQRPLLPEGSSRRMAIGQPPKPQNAASRTRNS